MPRRIASAGLTARRNGFTLLEMMVAVAILALLAGIAFPAADRLLERRALIEARGTVLLTLARARAQAIAEGMPVQIALTQGVLVLSGGRFTARLPNGIALDWPDGGVTVYSDGTTAQAAVGLHAGAYASELSIAGDTAQTRFD